MRCFWLLFLTLPSSSRGTGTTSAPPAEAASPPPPLPTTPAAAPLEQRATVLVRGYVAKFIRSRPRFEVGGGDGGSEQQKWQRAFTAAARCSPPCAVRARWLAWHAGGGAKERAAVLAFTVAATGVGGVGGVGGGAALRARLRSRRFLLAFAHAVNAQYRLPGLLKPARVSVTDVRAVEPTLAPTAAPTAAPPPRCAPGHGLAAAAAAARGQRVACALCGVGRYGIGGGATAGGGGCLACPAGRFGGTEGRFQAECEGPCPAGTYSRAGAARCSMCPPGKHQPLPAAPLCASAAARHRAVPPPPTPMPPTPRPTRTQAHIPRLPPLCDPGSGWAVGGSGSGGGNGSTGSSWLGGVRGRCEACAAGRFSLGFSRRACEECPAGRFGLGSSGTQACSGLCPRGRWGAGGSASALCDGACPAGRFGDELGARTNLCAGGCGAGRFGAHRGATSAGCSGRCAAGTSSRGAAPACAPCPAGKWSGEGAVVCSTHTRTEQRIRSR